MTSDAVLAMEKVMRAAVDQILEHGIPQRRFPDVSLNDMFRVSADFYRAVVTTAWRSCASDKTAAVGRKRLAKGDGLPLGLPSDMRSLEKLFRDKKSWPKIMRRSNKLTERLRKAYLQKLQRKFKTLLPRILENETTVEEAKAQMMRDWDASKSRVETIFRTETTKYFAETQVRFFKNDTEIIGFLFDSIRDKARTEICKARHGLIFRPDSTGKNGLAENTPALHYNCRSHLIPLARTPHNVKMLEDPARDPTGKNLPTPWE